MGTPPPHPQGRCHVPPGGATVREGISVWWGLLVWAGEGALGLCPRQESGAMALSPRTAPWSRQLCGSGGLG